VKFLLDANVISEIRKRDRAHPNVTRWVARTPAMPTLAAEGRSKWPDGTEAHTHPHPALSDKRGRDSNRPISERRRR
jgi:hypothetical protein